MDQPVLLQAKELPCSPDNRSRAVSIDQQDGLKSSFFRLRLRSACRISYWDPEDQADWEAGNKTIAWLNLLWSILTAHLGYSVWTLWPVMELFMPKTYTAFPRETSFCSLPPPLWLGHACGCRILWPPHFSVAATGRDFLGYGAVDPHHCHRGAVGSSGLATVALFGVRGTGPAWATVILRRR